MERTASMLLVKILVLAPYMKFPFNLTGNFKKKKKKTTADSYFPLVATIRNKKTSK